MRNRENERNTDIDHIHDPYHLHSDRGCSAETSINHKRRAFHAVSGRLSHPKVRFENMPCRRIATSDPANFRPRKLLRWAGEFYFIELWQYFTVADGSFQQYLDFIDNHTRCWSRATTFRRTRRCPLHIAILPGSMPWTVHGVGRQTNHTSR